MSRIEEQDLVLPALYVIYNQQGISTSELILGLRMIFNPIGEDAEILSGRSDDKFSQIVRNLVSHHTLDERFGFTKLSRSKSTNANHSITKTGKNFLMSNIETLENLFSNNFNYPFVVEGLKEINHSTQNKKEVHIFDENLYINEGRKKLRTTAFVERSGQLRNFAINKFLIKDRLLCRVCDFDFYRIYGTIGSRFIEIHHIKPIYMYEDTDTTILFEQAIDNLCPLCANCHRMIHRNRKNPLSVPELKEIVKSGVYY